MKIKFNSDDDLSLNKPLKFLTMTMVVRSIFEEIHNSIYMSVCMSYKK